MRSHLDPNSIQFRLTVGIVLASVLGIGGITGWTNLRMYRILIDGHKQNALEIANRFGQDIDFAKDLMSSQKVLQETINYRSTADIAIWLRSPSGELIAQSDTLSLGSWQMDGITDTLLTTVEPDSGLIIRKLQDRYFVICVGPLIVEGMKVGNLFVVDDITQDQESFDEVTRTLAISSLLVICLTAIGIALYVHRSLSPIRKMNRLAADISPQNLANARLEFDQAPTEVQELAQACNLMLTRISEAWDQQRRFVSDVSHELRTPLTLVQGYLQSTLRRCNTLSEPQREGLEIAAAEADRTIRLLQDLLDMARADGGHLRFNLEQAPLKQEIQDILDMCHYSSDRVQFQIDSPTVTARIDRNRLKQVLINLIDNALKYSEPGQPVQVRLSRWGDLAQIQVRDRGRGIPPTDLSQIFEPFYRVDEDRSRATGGTGLGLSIVKTLVQGMNGKISVQSKVGDGSLFTVHFPIQ